MTPIQLLPIFLEHLNEYFIALAWSLVVYFPIIRKLTYNIFDPLLFGLIGALFSHSMVCFLFIMDMVKTEYVLYFFASEFALLLGLLIFSCSKSSLINRASSHFDLPINRSVASAKSIFIISVIFYLFSVLIDYYLSGIPAFRISRQGAYIGSGGLGLIERINYVSYYFLCISMVFLFINNKKNILFYKVFIFILLVLVLITVILSGSRSKIIIFAFSWFYLYYYFTSSKLHNSEGVNYFCGGKGIFVLIFVIIVSLLVVFFSSGQNDIVQVIGVFLYRFVNFGDVFLYAYINDGIKYIIGDSPLIGLFGGFLSVFRVFPSTDTYTPMGIQLALIVEPAMSFVAGPNPRHNILGYHFFGCYGILFSFACGLLISYFRCRALIFFPKTFSSFIIYFIVMDTLNGLYTDFQYSMSNLASIIIVGTVFLFLNWLIPKR